MLLRVAPLVSIFDWGSEALPALVDVARTLDADREIQITSSHVLHIIPILRILVIQNPK